MIALLLALGASADGCSAMYNISSTAGPQLIKVDLKKKQRLCVNATSEAGLALIFNKAHESIITLNKRVKEDVNREDVESISPSDSSILGAVDFGAAHVGSAEVYMKESSSVSIAAAILPDQCRSSGVRVLTNLNSDNVKVDSVASGRSVCYFNGLSGNQTYTFSTTGGEVRVYSAGSSQVVSSTFKATKPCFVVFTSSSSQGSVSIAVSQEAVEQDVTQIKQQLSNVYGTKLLYGERVKTVPLELPTLLMIVVFALLLVLALVAVLIAFLCFVCRAKPIHSRPIVLDEHPSLMQAAIAETQAGAGDGMKARLVEASPTA